jgi:hypothetical protein
MAPVRRAAVVGLLVFEVPWAETGAQTRDGNFAGTIQCEALPALRPLRTTVTMTVAEGRARYEREIQHPTGGPSGTFERGEGPVGPSGEVTLSTRAETPGYSYEAEYEGRLEESTARLTGTQRWKIRQQTGTILRACSLDLVRVAQ